MTVTMDASVLIQPVECGVDRISRFPQRQLIILKCLMSILALATPKPLFGQKSSFEWLSSLIRNLMRSQWETPFDSDPRLYRSLLWSSPFPFETRPDIYISLIKPAHWREEERKRETWWRWRRRRVKKREGYWERRREYRERATDGGRKERSRKRRMQNTKQEIKREDE